MPSHVTLPLISTYIFSYGPLVLLSSVFINLGQQLSISPLLSPSNFEEVLLGDKCLCYINCLLSKRVVRDNRVINSAVSNKCIRFWGTGKKRGLAKKFVNRRMLILALLGASQHCVSMLFRQPRT